MKTQVSIPIETSTFIELVDFLREQGRQRDPVKAVSDAIEYWMLNAAMKPDDLLPSSFETGSRGFTWKYKDTSIFMPDGTEIRMRYKGKYHYARVQGDEIIYQGTPTSPGALANAVTSSSRNAWRDLWIKLPDSDNWVLADTIRTGTTLLKELEDPAQASTETK
jgi:hypothetical protein